jgi:hypothetical protein
VTEAGRIVLSEAALDADDIGDTKRHVCQSHFPSKLLEARL